MGERSSGSRPYRMDKRAEQVEETRQRIVQAAVDLHTTVGPSSTTISDLAERAGVARPTVYRHFSDQGALLTACFAHWSTQHPWPDPEDWRAIDDPPVRVRRALAELYAWYGEHGDDLVPIYRDLGDAPPTAREIVDGTHGAMVDALVAGWDVEGPAQQRLRAAAGHAVHLWTWHSLAVDQGLGDDQAAELAASLLRAAAGR